MSHNVFQSGFRINIEALRGKSPAEAYAYLEPILGVAKYVDRDDDGKVEYFEYDGKYVTKREFSYDQYESKDDGWCVDYVLCKDTEGDGDTGLYLSCDTARACIENLAEKFSVPEKDIMIVAYSWYNGADEPVVMKCM